MGDATAEVMEYLVGLFVGAGRRYLPKCAAGGRMPVARDGVGAAPSGRTVQIACRVQRKNALWPKAVRATRPVGVGYRRADEVMKVNVLSSRRNLPQHA